ncbi:MAG: urease accessory protein [Microbacteriaceae bacterium]|nr:urease accessory protein [Microbacteriaceae bacterium]
MTDHLRQTPALSAPTLSTATLTMMLADARLPVGGHVHSAGLEPALRAGMPASLVPEYMVGRALTVSLVEAGTAIVARHVALDLPAAGPIEQVEMAWAARTPSAAVREVSRFLGRGYSRLAVRLWPESPGVRTMAAARRPLSRPVVLGVIAAAGGMSAQDLVRLVVYDDAQTIAAALLKLDPIDPAIPSSWVLRACSAAEQLVPTLADLTTPSAIPAAGAPQIEEWAEAHSLTTQRLFRA